MSISQNAAWWVSQLNLQPHPEGGYYREVFRSQIAVVSATETTANQACTSIYYLLEGADYSGFHRLASDELWYFHKGSPLHIHAIDLDGKYLLHELSDQVTGSLSVVIPAGWWFGAAIPSRQGFALVSCAVAPAFNFAEFEMAKRDELLKLYPEHETIINRFCRE